MLKIITDRKRIMVAIGNRNTKYNELEFQQSIYMYILCRYKIK